MKRSFLAGLLMFLLTLTLPLTACTVDNPSAKGAQPAPAAQPTAAGAAASATATAPPATAQPTGSPEAAAATAPTGTSGVGRGANASPVRGNALTEHEQTIVSVVERVMPAVVGIGVEGRQGSGLGSGFIIDPNGYIVTNAHVVQGAQRVAVALADGRSFLGQVLGADPQNDLAVVKIEATGLPTVELGDSATLRPGQTAIAIGNPLGYARTVTVGVVSATGRSISERTGAPAIEDLVQTSAAINPGNSGGPLLDSQGRVIGVNTLGAADPSLGGRAEGIGFAVSVNTVKRLAPQWIKEGKVTSNPQPWIGVTVENLEPYIARGFRLPVQSGVVLRDVLNFGPAEQAGLRRGDIITAIDGRPTPNAEQLAAALNGKKPGDKIQIDYFRQGEGQKTATVTVGG